MAAPALSADELLAWNERTSNGWRKLLTEHPELLSLPCDIAGTKTIAELMQHIVAVELRYAERLASLPPTDYAAISFASVEEIFATHDHAITTLRSLIASDIDWNERIDFVTRTWGPASSSRRTILFHAILHGIRHYAQLATLVRHHGAKPDWLTDDYLLMDIEHA
jgi:uncharacterized damage-inducible protein DinB